VISVVFALLLVGSVAVAQRVGQASCDSILVASSNEKSVLLTTLAADYSSSHPGGAPCGPVVRVERVASGDAESRLESGWTGGMRPDVWAPQASTWVYLLRARLASAGRPQLIPDAPLPSLANSPLVVAMPQPMALALGWPGKQPSWSDLLNLAENPKGWAAVGQPEWGSFRLGKTDPETSTSGIHALIAAFYAATNKGSDITSSDVANPQTRAFVGRVELSVSHYADTADTFLHNLSAADDAGGALNYISAVTVEEQELWAYNQGDYRSPAVAPRVPLAAIYPSDGTLMADHPYITLPWADAGQRKIASDFLAWLLQGSQQARFGRLGFRDSRGLASASLKADSGIIAAQPAKTQRLPEPAVLAAIQSSWSQLRKRVHLLIVVDVSSASALAATAAAMLSLSSGDVVEVWAVARAAGGGPYRKVLAPTAIGEGTAQIVAAIQAATSPAGPGSIYAATLAAYAHLTAAPDSARINAVVVIANATDDASGPALPDLERQLRPVASGILIRVFAVAFPGSDASALQGIATASGGYFANGEPAAALRAAFDNT